MNRLDELKKYYYQCEKGRILEKHSLLIAEINSSLETVSANPIAKIDGSNTSTADLLMQLLKNWLEFSIEVWQKETQWCKQIFNDAHAIVTNLLTKCFEEFNKSFIILIDKFAAKPNSQEYFLDALNHFKQVILIT